MKYALVDGVKKLAEPGLTGVCHSCNAVMVPKCGTEKIWHWAHKSKKICDHWWETETKWHRNWKNLYPDSWQEIYHKDEEGTFHIADIGRPDGFFIEFQYSSISELEVRSRNKFYSNLIWVINGTRLSRDKEKIQKTLANPIQHGGIIITELKLNIVKKWLKLSTHTFIDFEDSTIDGKRRIFYISDNGYHQFLIEILVKDFVELSKVKGGLKPFVDNVKNIKKELIKIKTKPFREKLKWQKKYIEPFK